MKSGPTGNGIWFSSDHPGVIYEPRTGRHLWWIVYSKAYDWLRVHACTFRIFLSSKMADNDVICIHFLLILIQKSSLINFVSLGIGYNDFDLKQKCNWRTMWLSHKLKIKHIIVSLELFTQSFRGLSLQTITSRVIWWTQRTNQCLKKESLNINNWVGVSPNMHIHTDR